MAYTPYIVSGTTKNSFGNNQSNIKVTFTSTEGSAFIFSNSDGNYLFDLANIGYSDGEVILYTAIDKFGNELTDGNITVNGMGGQTLNITLSVRLDDDIRCMSNRGTTVHNIGGKPVSTDNPFPIQSISEGSDTNQLFTMKMTLVSSGQAEYVGEAVPGSDVSEAKWRIKKLEYASGTTKPSTGLIWANGNTKFDKIWNDRASYNYS